MLKRILFILFMALTAGQAIGQCSMCTKTAASLDDKSAKGLNAGILYLAALPLLMMGFVGFRWWKQNRE
ncbi:hypothetical protein EMGBS15_10240 [Filimonas sp.]|jgi:hypothetical protein|nr:hypothetical protein EMGBS15_10240 [Filimonas sp.]